jgi:hypothetical protein
LELKKEDSFLLWSGLVVIVLLTITSQIRRDRAEPQLGLVVGGGHPMNREVALKIVLALVGVLFLALAYPMFVFVRQDPALSMMLSLYATLGVFLLLAIRNPSASRSLIAFTAWSSLVHAALMGTQALRGMVARGELVGVAVLVVIGVALIALAPARQQAAARFTPE